MTARISAVLGPLESTEPFLKRALASMAARMEQAEAVERLAGVQIYLVDYHHAMPDVLGGRLYTDNCAALHNEDAILINQAYLLETEAAVRSFDVAGALLATPYLRSDEDLFSLVDRLNPDPTQYLRRLRALDCLPGRKGADTQSLDALAMLVMFLVGHELGHIQQGHDQRSFGAFVDPKAKLEKKVGNAVVKLVRHAREFLRLGFNLPGFEQVLNESTEMGSNAKRWHETLGDIDANHQRWFEDESDADDYAVALVQQLLDRAAVDDPVASDRLLVSVVNALFAAAIYHWQRDLAVFLRKLGLEHLSNAQELAMTMVQCREHYIHAAELFGPVHRFTLLRAVLAINSWLHARGVVRTPIGKPVRRTALLKNRPPLDRAAASQCSQREVLLRIHMDTAVKIANVGAATGWMMEKDRVRGSRQIFMMRFESIRQSVSRLQQMM